MYGGAYCRVERGRSRDQRHLRAGGLVLYDLSSSYFEGSCCPLAKRGYSRDGKKGLLQINYGLLTDARGCPVAFSRNVLALRAVFCTNSYARPWN